MANTPDDDVLSSGISKLKELSENDNQSLHRIGTIIEPVYRDMASPSTESRGVKTRINAIDKALGSLRNDDLIIIGARPSMGKSAFVLSLMLNMGVNGDPSALYSLEMSKESLTERLFCQASGVSMQDTILKMNMKDNNERLEKSIPTLYKLPIYIDDRTRKYNKIEQSIRRAVKSHGVKAAFIDYLQLIHTSKDMGDNRNHQLGYITRNLKSLAKELKIPIILLSQLNRSLESRPNKRPMLSDLRDSGEIEQDADVVIFLYRDEVYNKESDDKGIVEVDIAKARNLSLAWLKLAFVAPSMRFADLAENYDDYND
jgi:replicative DNA helicase